MKTVYFVRHGESEGNTGKIWSGSDTVLSAKGREQAEFVAERAKNIHFEVLISSPMTRARHTSEIISHATGHAIIFSDLFAERRRPSSISGMPVTDDTTAINSRWHATMFASGVRVEDGENFDDLKVRGLHALEFLASRPENAILVVAHEYFIRMLVSCVIFGAALDPLIYKAVEGRFRMQNTGITVFRYDEEADPENPWRIWVWNDHAHLG